MVAFMIRNVCSMDISSRELNQDNSAAKKATDQGPVIIPDRGRPAHVLLSIEEYQKLTGCQTSIVELLAMPNAAEIEFALSPAGLFHGRWAKTECTGVVSIRVRSRHWLFST